MKKRYHTNQKNFLFSLTNAASSRSKNRNAKQVSRGFSKNLAFEDHSDGNLVKKKTLPLSAIASWIKKEECEMKLADEISTNELNLFAFSCIESLANLAQQKKADFSRSINEALFQIVNSKLISFTKLVDESKAAKIEFRESVARSKELISSVQPLTNSSAGALQEMGQITTQMMECAERAMSLKCRSAALSRRVEFLVEAVSDYVGEIGSVMGLPKPLMDKVAKSVRGVLVEMAK